MEVGYTYIHTYIHMRYNMVCGLCDDFLFSPFTISSPYVYGGWSGREDWVDECHVSFIVCVLCLDEW